MAAKRTLDEILASGDHAALRDYVEGLPTAAQRERGRKLLDATGPGQYDRAWADTTEQWKQKVSGLSAQARADINRAFLKYGNEKLQAFLEEKGLTHNPDLLAFMQKAGEALYAKEQASANTASPTAAEKPAEQQPSGGGTAPTRDSILQARYPSMFTDGSK